MDRKRRTPWPCPAVEALPQRIAPTMTSPLNMPYIGPPPPAQTSYPTLTVAVRVYPTSLID